jgi:hypothetical protein
MEEAPAGGGADGSASSSSTPFAGKTAPEDDPRVRLEWQEAPVHGKFSPQFLLGLAHRRSYRRCRVPPLPAGWVGFHHFFVWFSLFCFLLIVCFSSPFSVCLVRFFNFLMHELFY